MFRFFGLILVLVVGITIVIGTLWTKEHTKTAIVCRAERTATSGGGEYRVYTANSGTFVITDSHWPWRWRTNSADVYGKLRTPGRYQLKYIGWRLSIESTFPNIMSFTRLPATQAQLRRACS